MINQEVITRLKAQLRLTEVRLHLLQQKEISRAKQDRLALAMLMKSGKVESARIRVENIIQQDIYVELLEYLELKCSLVQARLGMIERLDDDARLKEALYTLIYCAPHTDVKELRNVKEILSHILPKEFYLDAIENQSGLVAENIYKRTHPDTPSEELVTLYLQTIAQTYNVRVKGIYEPVSEPEPEPQQAGAGGAAPAAPAAPAAGAPKGNPPADDLAARFAALRK